MSQKALHCGVAHTAFDIAEIINRLSIVLIVYVTSSSPQKPLHTADTLR